jgi:long-chain acyl-CoA synthetase
MMGTGSASISKDILDFNKIAFCCPILECYGSTETAGIISATNKDDPCSEHVGGPMNGVKIRLRSNIELGYSVKDIPYPRGEI